jgi:hypothetical protein
MKIEIDATNTYSSRGIAEVCVGVNWSYFSS